MKISKQFPTIIALSFLLWLKNVEANADVFLPSSNFTATQITEINSVIDDNEALRRRIQVEKYMFVVGRQTVGFKYIGVGQDKRHIIEFPYDWEKYKRNLPSHILAVIKPIQGTRKTFPGNNLRNSYSR